MKKGDKIAAVLIAALIMISIVGVFSYKQYVKSSHPVAVIKQDGKVIKTIDLSSSKGKQQFKIPYDENNYNIVEVESGKIRFIDADCPDKVCVKTGWISKPGESAVCLPHKTIINIEGNNENYDQISS
ncbi:NusG domain II-containing protein [Clostridium sp. A1-XYC3]|uniref:NusG domain II-containing protein n=1 Tax=Clostridium tanneri TaxID=3037988 RepID=A0ABU4JMZ9_9CLOT|nr:NusG domain II-containing protein [Clostridium sp. A1-XYC3]MDW8799543.1 NusG domain II-containing protein [Clostridium sp. A1-XYC3]